MTPVQGLKWIWVTDILLFTLLIIGTLVNILFAGDGGDGGDKDGKSKDGGMMTDMNNMEPKDEGTRLLQMMAGGKDD
jgi:hypothetical protein